MGARLRRHGRTAALRAVGLVAALAAALAGFGVLPGETGASTGGLAKISPQVLSDTASGGETQFVVYLGDQADLSAAYAMSDQDARGWYVYRTLREHAARTQAPIVAQLKARGVPYRSFWAANVVMTEGDRSLVDTLAARADVKAIESDDKSDWIQDVAAPSVRLGHGAVAAVSPQRPSSRHDRVGRQRRARPGALGARLHRPGHRRREPGHRHALDAHRPQEPLPRLERHHRRPQLQLARRRSTRGGGILRPRHRRSRATTTAHGTHTTGTTSGDDGARQPDRRRPGREVDRLPQHGPGHGTPATYTECFQFFIAPTDLSGQNADPTKRPHVINNSWACPPSEGCAAEHPADDRRRTRRRPASSSRPPRATRARPAAPSPIRPRSTPPPSRRVRSTARNTLAGFSSRGPVTATAPTA